MDDKYSPVLKTIMSGRDYNKKGETNMCLNNLSQCSEKIRLHLATLSQNNRDIIFQIIIKLG